MGFGARVLLRDVSFRVTRGQIFVIMGGSGSGKSTLLRALLGLHPPMAGEIRYGGEALDRAPPGRRDGILRRFGVLYQSGALFSSMTLAENVAVPLKMHTRLSAGEIAAVARLKLALVGLRGSENLLPAELSGGMQKRAGIARAMALDPEILFLDEPSAGLDPMTGRRLDELILALRNSLGTTVVLVTHELDSIFRLADDGIFLDGERERVIGAGSPRELLAHSREQKVLDFLTRGGDRASTEETRA
ncbi:MAG TPA: ATP-binding cassette domain-containing protein [Polyangia bacterium]|nr:ATP-binding cassette domain-containing protein [Polyangia bacterium]